MSDKGFFASLFDLSFTSLITTKIIKLIYVVSLILIGLSALGLIVAAFNANAGIGLATLFVIAPLGALFYTMYTRLILEFVIAVFRIAEHTRDTVDELRAARDDARTPAAETIARG